jgi:hypothetical protein
MRSAAAFFEGYACELRQLLANFSGQVFPCLLISTLCGFTRSQLDGVRESGRTIRAHSLQRAAQGEAEPASKTTGWSGVERRDGRASGPAAASNSRDVSVVSAALCFTRLAYKYLFVIFILHVLYYKGITEALIV